MGEFGVSDKEAKKNSSGSVLGLGVKVQTLEVFPSKTMMMMVPHNHHHRPLSPFDNDSCAGDGDGDGPTTYMSMTNHTNHLISDASASGPGAAIDRGGAAVVRPLQPFDISTSTSVATTRPAFKSSAGGMAASMGFPFTNAQWKELERQAIIYKYMMASVAVPPDLLIPTAACRPPLDSGFNLRFSSSTDPEPGRCRRTDGKKWRCSRDVAPNHKYCERHMHRGRPRSRKPVEVQANSNSSNNNQQIKRARHDYRPFPTPAVTVPISNPTINNDGSSSQFLASTTSQPYFESSLSLDKFGVKAANFVSFASVSSNNEPRGLDWMLKGDPISMAASNPEWQPLMQNKVGLNTGSSYNNNASISTGSNYKDALYMNSYALINSELDQQSKRFCLSLNPLAVPVENPQSVKPRGFIDAWSNAETEGNDANANNKNSVASNAKLSLSSLDLSMGGGGSVDENMGTIQMGLGLMEPEENTENGTKTHLTNWLTPAPWVASTPGGPLAEVLRPSTVASTSNPSSPVITNAESGSPMVTMVSSPSGVLPRTLASLSDSSSSSSPRVASSRANSEIALLWFNQSKLASSS